MKRAFAVLVVVACAKSTPPPAAPAAPPPPPRAEAPTPSPPAPASAPAVPKAYSGLGAESVTAETIQKFAPPPLDDSVGERIQRMLDIRGTGGGLVTSKGDRIAFTWRITGQNQVWRQDGPMKFPVQLTGGEDNTQAVALSPDDKWIVVSRDRGGAENPGLYLLDIEGGPLVQVFHKKDVRAGFGFISDDGHWLYFTANDIEPSSYALYRYDLKKRQTETVFSEPGIWSPADHQGDRVLMAKALGSTHIELYELDLASKKLTPLLGQNESEEYDAAYGARPGTLLVRTNKLGDLRRIYEWKEGKLTPITPEMKHDISSLIIDDKRTRILYTVNEGGYSRLYALDARTYKPAALPNFPGADNVGGGQTTPNGRFTMIGWDSATRPTTSVTYDWQTHKATQWRLSNTPEVDVGRFTRASLETYPARDGTPIPMFVWRPASCAEPCPVVVSFHGGPESQSTAGFSTSAQLYVDAGFVFVAPNVRGSDGYGKAWLHSDDGPRRLEVITDIEDCARYIRSAWAKDGKPPRIGVTGGSYGGYSTLMAMTYFAGAYDAGVAQVGMSNLVTFLMNTAPYRRILRISEYGDPEKDKDALVKLSPTTYVDRVKSPLLLIQGVNDPRVPVNEAVQIHYALERRGVVAGLILFPDEGHGASKRANQALAIGHTVAFFEKYLK